jgi:hypothetical protein
LDLERVIMPKYRKLAVKATESLDINDMPDDFTRLLWVMLPLGLCREGRGIDNPAWIKAKIMPLRADVTPEMIEEAMSWYAGRGMVLRYEVLGRRYFQMVNWKKYQGDTGREAASEYPAPNSGPSREFITTKSGLDAYAYTDADANTYANANGHKHTAMPILEAVDEKQDQVDGMITEISKVVKETLAPGFNEAAFESAAKALVQKGVTPEELARFPGWWQANGHYSGKPAIKSLLLEIDNCINGVTHEPKAKAQPAVKPNPATTQYRSRVI